MIFNSLNFVAFFALVYGLYLALPHRGQNRLLLVASYVFYASWDWRFLSLLLLSTVVDFVLAQRIEDSTDPRHRRRLLVVSMVVSLTVLGFFKYCNFFVDNLEALLRLVGLHPPAWHLNVILPWGISFYTFQTMNYTIDVYRGHLRASRCFPDFAVFVSFFPHLVAGPIMRASSLLPQVTTPRRITWAGVQDGGWLILWGLFKKVVVADNLANIADAVFGQSGGWTASSVLLGVYAFAFQIYCDFSGYSDMARGISKLMGFELMINFRNPYFATDPSDFWRRWHISLSTWLRDYLYIPLGGNRRGPGRTQVNLMLTMLLGGLWHGAAWTFVLWGAFHGALLMAYRKAPGGAPAGADPLWRALGRRVLMFHLVCLSWLLFRATDAGQVGGLLAGLAVPGFDLQHASWLIILVLLTLPVLALELAQELSGDLDLPMKLSIVPRLALVTTCLLLLLVLGNTGGHAFIYFQF